MPPAPAAAAECCVKGFVHEEAPRLLCRTFLVAKLGSTPAINEINFPKSVLPVTDISLLGEVALVLLSPAPWCPLLSHLMMAKKHLWVLCPKATVGQARLSKALQQGLSIPKAMQLEEKFVERGASQSWSIPKVMEREEKCMEGWAA